MTVFLMKEQWTFALLAGAEKAQIGWHMLQPAGTTEADAVSQINSVTDLWTGWRAQFPATTSVTERVIQFLDPSTGELLAQLDRGLPSGAAGTASGNALPPQTAEVMTIRTATPGRSGRGRFYLPMLTTAILPAEATIPAVTRGLLVTPFGEYCQDLQALTPAINVGVWSRVLHSFSGATEVDMGSTFDTQRSRRNKIVEARTRFTI